MIATVLAAAVVFQSQFSVPDIQPGSNQQFISAVSAVKKALSEENFEEAARLAAVLPREEVTYTVREDTMPPEYRAYAQKAIDRAIALWSGPQAKIKVRRTDDNPDIVISFAPQLGNDPETQRLLGAAHFIAFDPNEPRVDTVIGLKRGDPIRSTETNDIGSEMSFAIGARLGLERSPVPGTPMGRYDGSLNTFPRMAPLEAKLGQVNIEIGNALRQAAAEKIKVAAPDSGAHIDVNEINGPTVMQGDRMPLSFQVANNGKSPLKFRVVPDCGCFILPVSSGELAPGDAQILQFDIDTLNFPGKLDKSLFVYTTDPEMPVKRIPVRGMIEPIFQFISPTGRNIFAFKQDYQEINVFLEINPKFLEQEKDFKFTDVQVSGMKEASAEFEPWEGEIADALRGEASRRRAGFNITIHAVPNNLPGRQEGLLTIATSSQTAPIMRWAFSVQNGILVAPSRIYFGEIDGKPSRAWTTLSAVGKKVNITKIESDNKLIEGSWEPYNEDHVKIVAHLKAGGSIGQFDAVLTVHTDDPDYPVVSVPVQGIIK